MMFDSLKPTLCTGGNFRNDAIAYTQRLSQDVIPNIAMEYFENKDRCKY